MYFLCEECRHCIKDVSGGFLIFCKIFQKFPVRRICPFKTLLTKCHTLLQCSNLLLMPCDVPLKVMHTTYCHVESDPSGVKERRMKGSQRDTGQTNEAKDRTLDVSSLQCRSHNKEFQGHQDEKKRNHNPEVPLFPLPTNTTFPPHLFVFFFPLFLSLSLSSRCVVSLIGRQTACKCSNPEKSPGALVIGCALQHSSQSIKAR